MRTKPAPTIHDRPSRDEIGARLTEMIHEMRHKQGVATDRANKLAALIKTLEKKLFDLDMKVDNYDEAVLSLISQLEEHRRATAQPAHSDVADVSS